ncbi:hypothetical protein JJC03_09135 [Flavobacterium oreochromis]|uniref:hypothetical protein n=1 Tax=Flavobacterium oreochromis TaxID=2906078 RepID=UPI001CE57F7B|nr:hypothetical protein [Flavobacterium oreochromis]QYS85402.1 hypothetical protein JJC03_09135 [Flavobacterium oreochromis]
MLSTSLSTQDIAGIVKYLNTLVPDIIIPANSILKVIVTDTGQMFEVKVNNRVIGKNKSELFANEVIQIVKNDEFYNISFPKCRVIGYGLGSSARYMGLEFPSFYSGNLFSFNTGVNQASALVPNFFSLVGISPFEMTLDSIYYVDNVAASTKIAIYTSENNFNNSVLYTESIIKHGFNSGFSLPTIAKDKLITLYIMIETLAAPTGSIHLRFKKAK